MRSPLILKRPASGRFGGYSYLAKSGAAQAIADDIIFESVTAGAYTLTVNPATVAVAGSLVALRRGLMLSALPGTVAVTGQTVGLSRVGLLTVLPGSVAITGQSVTTQVARRLVVLPALVSATGQSVGMSVTQSAAQASSGVRRMQSAGYWSPDTPYVVSLGFEAKKAEPAEPAKVEKPRPKPPSAPVDLLAGLTEVERRTAQAEVSVRTDAASELTVVHQRLQRVADLEKKVAALDVETQKMKRAALRKRIEREDEMIIIALLAA